MEDRTYPREWFGVNSFSPYIEALQFQRETERYLHTGTRKYKKTSEWRTWHPTHEEAQAAIDERIAREQETERVKRIRDAAPELLDLAEGWEITGPDGDGLLWLVLHPRSTTGQAMFNLGPATGVAGQVAAILRDDRIAAIAKAKGNA